MKLTRKKLLSVVTTLTIVLLLYFSGPTSAITVVMSAITATLYQGDSVTLQSNVTIQDYEFIMTTGVVNLTINTTSNGSFSCSLPINGTNAALSVTCDNDKTATVTSTVTPTGGFAYGYGYGYEYGYTPSATPTYEYSYGYGYIPTGETIWNATNLYYSITLPLYDYYGSGTFNATTRVYANAFVVDTATVQFTVNALTSLPGQTEGGGKITEVYMNPVGDDSAKEVCDGEWVEIYNNKSTTVNLTDWNLTNREGQAITIDSAHLRSGSSIVIPAIGFTVVCFNASDGYTDWLDNSEETVSLVAANGSKWDSLTYSASGLYAAGFTSLITTNVTEANSEVSIAQTTYYFKKNISLIVLANGSMAAVEGGTPGATNPGGSGTATVSLVTGWNLISLPLTPTNMSINVSLTSIYDSYTLAYLYNASTSNWSVYNPYTVDMATNSLNNTVPGYGYWIKVNATTVTLTI